MTCLAPCLATVSLCLAPCVSRSPYNPLEQDTGCRAPPVGGAPPVSYSWSKEGKENLARAYRLLIVRYR